MAILTRPGRAALAAAIKAQPLHVGLGEGDPDWDTDKTGLFAFEAGLLTLPHRPVSAVVVKSPDLATTYAAGEDFTIDAAEGQLVRLPEGLLAADASVHVAYRVERPAENPTAAGLLDEVGRRTVDEVAFVVPDAAGAIVVPTGRYSVSATPTNHLFVRVRFDFADASTAVIREQGLFVGSVLESGLPPGQRFFAPAEVEDPGILLLLQHSVPLIRQPSTRESFEFVVTF